MTRPVGSVAKKPATRQSPGNVLPAHEAKVGFDTSVFVNCPFDDGYLPLLRALLFTVHDCGFVARLAVEDSGAAEQRIAKICRLIEESRLSIHDISRIELSQQQYPRFNMPFEAGIAYGAIQFDSTKARDMLVLEAQPYRDQITLSDLAGTDPKTHGGEPKQIIAAVRGFLARKKVGGKTRGADAIWLRYETFNAQLPAIAETLEFSLPEIQSFDYLNEWLQAMSAWLMSS